ncbi:MAG TPA: hypothetical protein VFR44_10960, partial [Actinomycetota bacterium]|nr:hypothetical protein [Actinomycetota bacterium]
MRLNPESLARSSSRHPWTVVGLWVLVVAGLGFASQKFLADSLTSDVDFTNNPESKQAMQLIEDNVTGEQKDTEFIVVRHDVLPVSDPTFEQYVRGVQQHLMELGDKTVAGDVVTVYDALEAAGLRRMRTTDPPGVLVSIQLNGPANEEIRSALQAAVDQAVTSEDASAYQVQVIQPQQLFTAGTLTPDTLRVDPPELVAFITSSSVEIDDPDPIGEISFSSVTEAVRGAIAAAGGDALAGPPLTYFDIAGLISTDGRATIVSVPIVDTEIVTVERLKDAQAEVDTPGDGFETFLA